MGCSLTFNLAAAFLTSTTHYNYNALFPTIQQRRLHHLGASHSARDLGPRSAAASAAAAAGAAAMAALDSSDRALQVGARVLCYCCHSVLGVFCFLLVHPCLLQTLLLISQIGLFICPAYIQSCFMLAF